MQSIAIQNARALADCRCRIALDRGLGCKHLTDDGWSISPRLSCRCHVGLHYPARLGDSRESLRFDIERMSGSLCVCLAGVTHWCILQVTSSRGPYGACSSGKAVPATTTFTIRTIPATLVARHPSSGINSWAPIAPITSTWRASPPTPHSQPTFQSTPRIPAERLTRHRRCVRNLIDLPDETLLHSLPEGSLTDYDSRTPLSIRRSLIHWHLATFSHLPSFIHPSTYTYIPYIPCFASVSIVIKTQRER